MPIFGCHSCGFDLVKHVESGGTYENSRCATCKLAKEYYQIPKAAFYDSEDYRERDDGHDDHHTDENLIVNVNFGDDDDAGTEQDSVELATPEQLKLIRDTIERQTWTTISSVIIKLLKMAKENPVMFEVVIKKMQFPYMSYSEIGDSMKPRITKQNVLYNLKHAIEEFPDLSHVFITDTRFSAGKNALETVAHKCRREASQEELKGVLYGTDERLKTMALKTVNDIIHAPWMGDCDAIYFNYYGNDEWDLRQERERQRNREKWEQCKQD